MFVFLSFNLLLLIDIPFNWPSILAIIIIFLYIHDNIAVHLAISDLLHDSNSICLTLCLTNCCKITTR